jgi:molecular chaperone IbpA
MNQVIRFDPTTLNALNRAFLGFDDLLNDFENRYATQINTNYPPYNTLKHDKDTYEVQVAVTGFDPKDITVEVDQNQLIVRGETQEDTSKVTYLHRGLAGRNFTRVFQLSEHLEVGEAKIKNGVLSIELKRVVPEALKPRVLKIKAE